MKIYSRIDVLEFFQKPLILSADLFLIPQHLFPGSIKLCVFSPQSFIFVYVIPYKLSKLGSTEFRQFVKIDSRRSWKWPSFSCRSKSDIQMMLIFNFELIFLLLQIELIVSSISYSSNNLHQFLCVPIISIRTDNFQQSRIDLIT